MRIEAERDYCVAAGNCVMVAAELFDQDDDGIVVVTVDEVPAADEAKAREAVGLCPAAALRLA